MKRFEGKGSERLILIHVQSDSISQAQGRIERTAPTIGQIKQERGTYAGNRSGIYN